MGARIMQDKQVTGAGPWLKSGAAQHATLVTFTLTGGPAGVPGALTALTVDFEGRIAGGPAVQLGQQVFDGGEIAAAAAYLFITDKPIDDFRANITALTVDVTVPVTVAHVNVDYKSELN